MEGLYSIVRTLHRWGFSKEERRLILENPDFDWGAFLQQQRFINDSDKVFDQSVGPVLEVDENGHERIRLEPIVDNAWVPIGPYFPGLTDEKKDHHEYVFGVDGGFVRTLDAIVQAVLPVPFSPAKAA